MTTPIPNTMQAAVLHRFGGIEQIVMQSVPVPEPGPREVLIRVAAVGVGSWDATEREGHYDGAFGMPSTFPYILGWDGAGTVAAVGASVSRFAPGERVYAASMPLPRGGFYAEYAVVDQDHVSKIPAGMSIEQAAAMPWDALTAVSGLELLELKAGTTVMIFGASGGIGHMAVQLARKKGARVFAVASGADGVALAQRLGADLAIDGRREDVLARAREFAGDGLDAALVTVGGEATDLALTAIRSGGRVASPHGVFPEPQTPAGVQRLLYNGERDPAAIERLNRIVESGGFEVHVAASFALHEAAAAHRALAQHYTGKMVLRVEARE